MTQLYSCNEPNAVRCSSLLCVRLTYGVIDQHQIEWVIIGPQAQRALASFATLSILIYSHMQLLYDLYIASFTCDAVMADARAKPKARKL